MTRLVQAAERYVGTPWVHLGRDKRGLDCAGLLWRAYADCGVILPIPKRYGRDPFKEGLRTAMVAALGEPIWQGPKGSCRLELLRAGDIFVMSPASKPRHVAMAADDTMYGKAMIHSDGTIGTKIVRRDGIGSYFLKQIVEIYRRPIE